MLVSEAVDAREKVRTYLGQPTSVLLRSDLS